MTDIREDLDVKRWLDNLSEGSPNTAVQYLKWLSTYCKFRDKTPADLVIEFNSSKKKAQDAIEDYLQNMKAKGNAPSTRNVAYAALRSWFKRNDPNETGITREIKIGGRNERPTLESERVPTTEELRNILGHASVRVRAIIGIFAFTGIRPGAIAGLQIRDFPEMKIESGKIKFEKEPIRVNVRPELSKNKQAYFGFLISEGCRYLKAYLEQRIARGESLGPNSPIITVERNTLAQGKITQQGDKITAHDLSHSIRKTLNEAGFKARPYVLRSYFDTAIQNGKLPHVREQFYMGHKGPIETDYSVRKRIEGQQLEQMRDEFKRSVEYQLTTVETIQIVDPKQSHRTALTALGMTPEKVEEMLNLMGANIDWSKTSTIDIIRNAQSKGIQALTPQLSDLFRIEDKTPSDVKRKTPKSSDVKRKTPKSGKSKAKKDPKIIVESQLQQFLNEGWEIKVVLPSGKIVVEK